MTDGVRVIKLSMANSGRYICSGDTWCAVRSGRRCFASSSGSSFSAHNSFSRLFVIGHGLGVLG